MIRNDLHACALLAVLLLAAAPAHAQRRAATPPPAAAPADSAPRAGRASWTSDGGVFAAGDAVTVLLDEYTLASSDRNSSARAERSTDADLAASQDVVRGGSLPASVGAGLSSGRRVASAERGESYRQNRVRGEITVRVAAVERGLLRLEGSKRVRMDRGWEEVKLTGWVRPADVGAGNVVQSYRVAELELVMASRGGGPRQGMVSRIVGMLWP